MDGLTMFGAASAAAMVVSYAFERRHHAFTFAFAVACALSAVYAFLAGTWVFGVLEIIWFVIAMQRWMSHAERAESPDTAAAKPPIRLERS